MLFHVGVEEAVFRAMPLVAPREGCRVRLESPSRARGPRSGGESDSVAFDAALRASDESKFMSAQVFMLGCGISTLLAAIRA